MVIGAKQFTEQWIIGELYKQALTKAGYNVELKSNIGSTTIIDGALTSGQIDVYPEYTGVILQVLAKSDSMPPTAAQTFREAKAYQETRGLTMLDPTPFQNRNAVGVKPEFAKKYGLKTISDLKKADHVVFAEYPDNMEGALGYHDMVKTHGLTNTEVKSLNIGLQYPALDNGQVDAADVFTTDPQLARGDYTILKDVKGYYGFQNVAPSSARACRRSRARIRRDAEPRGRPAHRRGGTRDEPGRRHRAPLPSEVATEFLRVNDLI
ncbi:glycine betaine ABC transporter substrate-binding protein [Streptomyces sp. M10(2022)]